MKRNLSWALVFIGLCCLCARAGNAQSLSPLPPRWSFLGPSLINNGQGIGLNRRASVTGRINAIAPNPLNPLGDVWVGSATGGVWHGSVSPFTGWQPMTDGAPSLAVGDLELDSCTLERCATVWVGTGENSIRRDTQYGKGVLKLTWNAGLGRYDWTLLGEEHFGLGSIARLRLDPRTPDDGTKTVFVALSSGVTANASQSTVTTEPPGPYGIWRSRDAGRTWANVLPTATPATDLEMDPQAPGTLFAGVRFQGIYKSTDGGDTWRPIHNGIPAQVLASADWPEIAVFRSPGMTQPILYAALAECPHPHDKNLNRGLTCSPFIYRSADGGASWVEVHQANSPRLIGLASTYSSYTHTLVIHPSNPNILWYGGLFLNRSVDGGATWSAGLSSSGLHFDQHEMVVWPSASSATGVLAYDANDGGFFVGDGSRWSGSFQQGLAVTQFQSIASSPGAGFLLGGTQDNGSNLWLGTDVWEHVNDGDAASTLIDLDHPGILYDDYFGTGLRRCAAPSLPCGYLWPEIRNGIADNYNVSWYAPLVQDPTPAGGQHPLYVATHLVYRSLNDGDVWSPITQGVSPGGTGKIEELNGIQNPVSALAVSPSNRNRLYIGYYDGQLFTTANAWAPDPAWTKVDTGLPAGRPVTSIAVHPLDDRHVLASFSGFGAHSVFASTSAGASWTAVDDSADGELAGKPVNALLIEPRYPHRVWAGTDYGVWSRPDPNPGAGTWERSPGLPNVAVYELDLAGDGESILAATHGRGVWRFSAAPLARVHAVSGGASSISPVITVAAAGFDPNQSCTLTLLEGNRTCGTSAVDAAGAGLSTDGQGFLVSAGRSLSWVCKGGVCASSGPCGVSAVRVTCGGRTAQADVPVPGDGLDPRSTELGINPSENGGTFTVTARLRGAGGSSTALCSQIVSYDAGETDGVVLNRAASALGGSSGCQQAGVRAAVTGNAEPGLAEDIGPQPFRLSLAAPSRSGDQLVTEVSASGPASFTVDAYGNPAQGQAVPAHLALGGNAAGGRLEVTERSLLGACTVAVDTAAGEPAESVAARLRDAFLAPGTAFRLDPCLPGQNPRDVELAGAALRFPLGRQITVTSTDPALSFTIGGGL